MGLFDELDFVGKADDVQYRTAKIERGPLSATVSASGAVNPVTQVSVGTQVSGQIKDLYVDFNSEVKAGQLIAVIDPETFEYRVRQAQADVDAARAAVHTAEANAARTAAITCSSEPPDPRFEVRMRMVLRKSTVRPWPSVSRPSSSTCSSTSNTSGWAFSTSSNSTTV